MCERLKITAEVTYGNDSTPIGENMHAWTVTLKKGRRRLATPFWTGSAISREPSAADVLGCLVSDAQSGEMSFPEFCSEFGYDEDSRKAEKTHAACAAMSPKLRRFLGEDFDAVARAEH